jgi:hypothetical protein
MGYGLDDIRCAISTTFDRMAAWEIAMAGSWAATSTPNDSRNSDTSEIGVE